MPLSHDPQLRRLGPASRGTISHHAKDQPAGWHPCVASHLIAAVAACGPLVIVDLAGLEGIGCSGLPVLLRVRRWTRRSGGDLPQAAPQQPVRRILEATGLIDVFAVYPSVEEAANRARQ
jgi:anti-anti-sigma factor